MELRTCIAYRLSGYSRRRPSTPARGCNPSCVPYNEENMASDPNEPQNAAIVKARAIKEAAGYVTDTIKFFDDQERKQILDQVLSELDSKLAVR
jgi:hypothetical protein